MTVEAPVPENAPVMVAWKSYLATEEYANSFGWAAHEEHRKGSMWAAFYAGFYACAVNVAEAGDDPQPYKDALEDLLFCRGEQHAIGGGPGWQERDAKAWAAAEELMRVEP